LAISSAEQAIRSGQPNSAIPHLAPLKDNGTARALLLEALTQIDNAELTIHLIETPKSEFEAVLLGFALAKEGNIDQVDRFLENEFVRSSNDASVREIRKRLQQRTRQ
jgi:hypothetical protein